MRCIPALAAAWLAVSIAVAAQATVISGPITNPANGHHYYLLSANSWTASEAEAVALGGHLVTINDQAENIWVYDHFEAFGGIDRALWIGFNDASGTYNWSSGQPVTYTSWYPGQPDHSGGHEYYANFIPLHDPGIGNAGAYLWNDWPDNPSPRSSFGVVELVPVPEPATLFLLSLAAIPLLRRKKV